MSSNFIQLWLCFRKSLFEEAGKYFDKETGVLEAPMIIRVADQVLTHQLFGLSFLSCCHSFFNPFFISLSLSLTQTHPHRHSQHLPVYSHYLLHSSPLLYHQNLNYYCNIVSWLFLLFIDPASPFYCPSCADHIRHGVWHHWYRLWMLHHLWVN